MTKTVTKRKCRWCPKRFKPLSRGRRPLYCSQSCRQRAYEARRAQQNVPGLLLGRDMGDIRTKAGVKRAVVEVLRELGLLPETPKIKPAFRLVDDDET